MNLQFDRDTYPLYSSSRAVPFPLMKLQLFIRRLSDIASNLELERLMNFMCSILTSDISLNSSLADYSPWMITPGEDFLPVMPKCNTSLKSFSVNTD